MQGKIGFVLNGPIRYTETFLIKEFELLRIAGYKIIVFEGFHHETKTHTFNSIKALPISLKNWKNIIYIFTILTRLITFGLYPLLKFVSLELKTGASFIRIFKRVWFNAHILCNKVDYLHFCFADVAIQKEFTAKSIGARMSVSLRGSDILIFPKKNKNCYNKLWSNVEKIHVVSEWIYKKALELNLKNDTPFQIIYDVVDVEKIYFNDSDIHSPIRLLTIGRLEAVKDHEFALRVVKFLIDQNIKVYFTIVGDGSLKNYIQNVIADLSLSDFVTMKGKLSHQEVLNLMSAYDMYIHTSLSEGLNVSLLEAQTAGLLTISLQAGSTSENIENKKSGWIIEKRDVKEMAEKIIAISNLSFLEKTKVKLFARKRIEKVFDLKSQKGKWERFFKD